MLVNLLTGLPVMVLCLVLQAVFVAFCLRGYARLRLASPGRRSVLFDITLLAMVMLLMLVANLLQIGIWAVVFMLIGEFVDWNTAVYHSGVNFATLGYGDIVLTPRWRLLGPLEAANGIIMFGVSTAVMTAAVLDVVKLSRGTSRNEA